MMQQCPHCEFEAAPNANTCPKCGHSFLKEQLSEMGEEVINKSLDAVSYGVAEIFTFAIPLAGFIGFFYGMGRIYELNESPFGGRIDSDEQVMLWLFLLVVPSAILFLFGLYNAFKRGRKK